jgi:hypothetical protein
MNSQKHARGQHFTPKMSEKTMKNAKNHTKKGEKWLNTQNV